MNKIINNLKNYLPLLKKYLPFIVFGLGLLVVILSVVFVMVRRNKNRNMVEGEEVVVEVPQDKRPLVYLKPTADAHWLTLTVSDIKVGAQTLDYELLYDLPDGRVQGVPGVVDLSDIDSVERKLLLGSESSGKFRYDEGVKKGVLTLRFRDKKGKLIGKIVGEFSMNKVTEEVVSLDGKLKFEFDKKTKEGVVVILNSMSPEAGYAVSTSFTDNVKVTKDGSSFTLKPDQIVSL